MTNIGSEDPLREWVRIKTVLADALECSPEDRASFLERACAGDDRLLDLVERYLGAAVAAAGRFEHLDPDKAAALLWSQEPDPPAPESIGPFRILRELGRGGMGAVYLAERTGRDFHQQVALKLVKRGMDSDAILARFARERRILARLQHENIAGLLDGGTTEDGRPYLVMEFVDGRPLTVHCDDERQTVDDRLRLFLTVCGAVQYAHANLVVHRDLKPSNVLVTDAGRIKLLDFGIAGILEGGADDETTLTVQGLRPLTPEYAAPEQLTGKPTTTATDVYGLGVLLHELLTGHLPHRPENQSAAFVAGTGRLGDPARPSAVIRLGEPASEGEGTTDTFAGDLVAAARSTQARSLSRRLAGDLDAIVLKALRQEPENRYASVEALADDVRRHLSGSPVLARKGTLRYRADRFVRRHAFGLGVTGAAALMASAFLGFHLDAVSRERDIASQHAVRAEQVSQFVLDLFDRSDPFVQAEGDSLGIEELVDAGAARIQDELAGQPELQAELRIVLGRLLRRMGRNDEALRLFEDALEARLELFGEESEESAESMIYVADALSGLGEFRASADMGRRALEVRRRIDVEPADLASALAELGQAELEVGDLGAAEALLEEALLIRRRSAEEDPVGLGHALEYMAGLRREQGRFDDSVDLLKEAIEQYESYYGDDHLRTVKLRGDLGLVLTSASRYDEAEPVYREVLGWYRAALGDEHPATGTSLHNLGSLLLEMNRLEEAEVLLREAMAVRESALGETSTQVGQTLSKLATVLTYQGRTDEALELHWRTLDIRRANVGPRSSSVGTGLNQLGITLTNMGRPEEAIPVLQEAADIYREQRGERHWWVAVAVGNEARAWHELGELHRADSLYHLRHDINAEALGHEHFSTAEALVWIGRIAAAELRWADAVSAYAEALPVYETNLAADDTRVPRLKSELGTALSVLGRYDEAEPLLTAAAEASDDAYVHRQLEEHHQRVAAGRSGGGPA